MKRSKKLEAALARSPAVGESPKAPPRKALRAMIERMDALDGQSLKINEAVSRASVEMGKIERKLEEREKDYLEAFFRAEDAERREQVLLRELGRL